MRAAVVSSTVVLFSVFFVVNKSHGFLHMYAHIYKCVVDFNRLNAVLMSIRGGVDSSRKDAKTH